VTLCALVLATTLRFTLPDRNAIPGSCGAAEAPLDDLGYVQLVMVQGSDTLWGQPRMVVGKEGARDSFTVDLSGTWTVMVRTSDRQYVPNWSCLSNPVVVVGGAPLGIPANPIPLAELYDLAGRRVKKPVRSGVYFRVEIGENGVKRKRIVVIR